MTILEKTLHNPRLIRMFELHELGCTYGQIGLTVGVSKTYAFLSLRRYRRALTAKAYREKWQRK